VTAFAKELQKKTHEKILEWSSGYMEVPGGLKKFLEDAPLLALDLSPEISMTVIQKRKQTEKGSLAAPALKLFRKMKPCSKEPRKQQQQSSTLLSEPPRNVLEEQENDVPEVTAFRWNPDFFTHPD
jgi:hypothetical protein